MSKKKTLFKRILSGFLSAACVLSGTVFAGAALIGQSDIQADAAAAADASTFSWDNATVYFLLTDRFCNGDTSNDNAYGRQSINVGDQRATFHGGDFAGITKKINEGYFDDLGVNAIWLTAPYEQIHGYIVGGDTFYHYSYHGYYVLDYTEPDKAYGTKAEFQTMVDTAHEHGIRIVMDIVMNHAGYNSMYDMNEYNYGTLKSGWQSFYNNPNTSSTSGYHDNIDYNTSASDWGRWWGNDWVRSGLPGYTDGNGGSEETQCLTGLPDFRTEQSKSVSVPQFLQTKWQQEGTLSAKNSKFGTSNSVTGFISSWLADWVETYGIDGFRCDTAKHVEKASWKALKTKCVAALKKWKQNNPSKKLDDLDFWMTGEHWNHGCYKDGYYTEGGFDSMINFETTGGGMVSQANVANTYKNYAASINSDDSFNVLSYVSSHDSTLARPSDMYALGSAFLMLPGCVQIYYGDETARPWVSGVPQDGNGGAGHSLRSDMPWNSLNTDLINHWGIVGRFRRSHVAVGGGSNYQLTASNGIGFGRSYSKNGVTDKVAGVIYASANTQVSLTVSDLWPDGTQLHNFYDDSYAVVSGGKVTFSSGAHGTILIEEPSGPRGTVKVTHINKDSGETLKTETLSGGIGESYQTQPLTLEGFTVASTSGATTGTFSETEASVTYYYTFDSANYGFVVTKYVDAATNAEIADSVSITKRVGQSYTTTAASIKNYELDTVPGNATGTVSAGTTTVTYKYNYVEPTNLIVHYNNPSGWSAVSLYAYDESTGTAKQYTGAWPGKAMTKGSDGWWTYEVDGVENATIIFNNNGAGAQEPSGVGTPGYDAAGEVWVKGGKVYPTGKVTVKYVTTTGTVLASEVLKGIADGTETYTTSAKTFTGYTLQSEPTNATGKYTAEAVSVIYTYASQGGSDVAVTGVTVSPSSVNVEVGSSVSVTATVAPSNATNKTITWSSANSSVAAVSNGTITGKSAGTTTVTATSNNGKTATVTVTVTSGGNVGDLVNNSTINSDKLTVGSKAVFSGAASGGTAPYKYTYSYKRTTSSKWTTLGTADTTNEMMYMTPSSTGVFDIRITVKDSKGATVDKSFGLTVVDGKSTAFKNKSSISGYGIAPNTRFYIYGAATGSSGYRYAYYYKRTTARSWTLIGTEFGTDTSVTFMPRVAVEFNIKVDVMDKNGEIVSKQFGMTVNDKYAASSLVNNSTINTSNALPGTQIILTGAASGTSGYKYAFYYKKAAAANWSTIGTAFGADTTAKITLRNEADYVFKVDVKDASGNIAATGFSVRISQNVQTDDLINTSKTSAANVSSGTRVTINGSATGGSAPYYYAFYQKKSTATVWNVLGTEYSETSSVSFTPSTAGVYDIKVMVMDGSGETAQKNFALIVS